MIKLEELCICSRCASDVKYTSFNRGNRTGKITCQSCGYEVAVIDAIIINTFNQANQAKIDKFNELYGENISIGSARDGYTEFVETVQFAKTKNKFKQIISFVLYTLLILQVYVTLFFISFFKRRGYHVSYDKEIRALAEMYYYVPEMAFMKVLEIIELKKFMQDDCDVMLDIGGGSGFVFDVLTSSMNIKSKINIDLFASDFKKYDYIFNEDINKSSLSDDSIDTAISISVLEHIPAIDNVYKSIYRMLKNGGRLFFTTPNDKYFNGLFLYRMLYLFNKKKAEQYRIFDMKNAHHCSVMSRDEIIYKLKSAGFKNISVSEFFPNRLHILFDLINLPAKLPRDYHFWSELYLVTCKRNLLKKIMTTFLMSLLQTVVKIDLSSRKQSHYCISCEK